MPRTSNTPRATGFLQVHERPMKAVASPAIVSLPLREKRYCRVPVRIVYDEFNEPIT